ncbi:MAG: phosphoribosylaminoimidazolecarboxamide formyltransferase, partial [Gemmatimonadetes bacterium]|nr:phosphoribosylaminoimidazolecarboxamide formyltransferase [Gemmatimonadota bacterium]
MAAEMKMRYGCNPHQPRARFFMRDGSDLPLQILSGAPSYINMMDALNSWPLVRELKAATGLP